VSEWIEIAGRLHVVVRAWEGVKDEPWFKNGVFVDWIEGEGPFYAFPVPDDIEGFS
jgi:hypothetical protein